MHNHYSVIKKEFLKIFLNTEEPCFHLISSDGDQTHQIEKRNKYEIIKNTEESAELSRRLVDTCSLVSFSWYSQYPKKIIIK